MNRPLVSIIIPVFNSEKYIYQTIQSIIGQSGRGLELIIIDDGSTDGTPAILEKYKSIDNVKIIRKENGGVGRARNRGIEEARGKYVNFCDHDDIIARGAYTDEIADILESENYDIVTFSDGFSDEQIRWGKVNRRKPGVFEGDWRELASRVRCSHQHSLWRKEMLGDVRFPPNGTYNEDWNFVNMALERAKSILARDDLWYIWRMIPSSVSHNYSKQNKMDVHYWIDSYVYRMEHTRDEEEIYNIAKTLLMHSFKAIYYGTWFGEDAGELLEKWQKDPNVQKCLSLVGLEAMEEVNGYCLMRNDPDAFRRYVRFKEGKFQIMKKVASVPMLRRINQRYRLHFTQDMRKYRPIIAND